MSDFLISLGRFLDLDAAARRLRWNGRATAWSDASEEVAWLVSRVDDGALWGPARDPQAGLTAIVVGRLALEEQEWVEAERLREQGGLASRLVLDRWHTRGAAGVQALNASGLIVIIDQPNRRLHLWTDRLGFAPAFMHDSSGSILLGSHPDVMADVLKEAGRPPEVDYLTLAEFLQTGTATHPNTHWRSIRQLDAGVHFAFKTINPPSLASANVYWRPSYLEGQPYIDRRGEAVERLSAAIKGSVRRRTLPRLGTTGVMLSAGADSRAALFGACEPAVLTCHTLCDVENEEVRSARQLATIAGAHHVTHVRDPDYYISGAARTVEVSGGMWSLESGHYTGIAEVLDQQAYGTVITGCYADYMMKGLAYNRMPVRLMSRELPLYELSKIETEFYLPNFKLVDNWSRRVVGRQDLRYGDINSQDVRAQSQAEHIRLSPIAREGDAASRLFLRRTESFDPYMSDAEIVDLFGRVHPRDKLNGVAFGQAVQRLAGQAAHIRNNNYYARVGASESERAAMFIWASLKRKVRARLPGVRKSGTPNPVATEGSWPNFGAVMRGSAALQGWWSQRSPEARDLLTEFVGASCAGWSLQDWSVRSPTLFIRYYTAALWLEARRSPGHAG